MSEINKEVEYLKSKISQVSYDTNRFKMYCGENKYVFGVISPEGGEAPLSKLMQYKTLYDTLKDLDWKIKKSFEEGLKYIYSEEVQKNFSVFNSNSEEENLAYYYIENALFRTMSLWDILAQLYCLFYQVRINKEKVYYKKVFNPKLDYSNKFKTKAKEINKYLKQEDDIQVEGEFEGNHEYTNNYRNKMTHRNSPNVACINDYDFNFKDYPSFILQRTIEDYATVSEYLGEILDEIEVEVLKEI